VLLLGVVVLLLRIDHFIHTRPTDMHIGALWEMLAELGVQRSIFHSYFGKPDEALHRLETARCVEGARARLSRGCRGHHRPSRTLGCRWDLEAQEWESGYVCVHSKGSRSSMVHDVSEVAAARLYADRAQTHAQTHAQSHAQSHAHTHISLYSCAGM